GDRPAWADDPRLRRNVSAAMPFLRRFDTTVTDVNVFQDGLEKASRALRAGASSASAGGRTWTSAADVESELRQLNEAVADALTAVDRIAVEDRFHALTNTLKTAGSVVIGGVVAFVIALALAGKPASAVEGP